MNQYILKDKLSYPVAFTLVWGILQFIFHKYDWLFLTLALSVMFLIFKQTKTQLTFINWVV